MDSPVQGIVQVDIAGKPHTLRFTWAAIDALNREFEDGFNLNDPLVLARVTAIGLACHHPDMTDERLMEISPPIVPIIEAVNKAYLYAQIGDTELPDKPEKKKTLLGVDGLRKRFANLFGQGLTQKPSGG